MRRQVSGLALGWLVLLAAAACGDVEQGQESPCTLNSDCPPPASCVAGACRVECVEERDCAEGLSCQGGQCVPGSCRADADCPYAHACVQGACEAIEGFCQQNSECPSGQACSRATSRCVSDDQGRPCQSTGDCFADEVCQGGQCVASEDAGCALNSDCDLGQICAQGRCVAGCTDDAGCPGGQICRQGSCVEGCASDFDCADGQLCRAGRCSAECVRSSDCDGGLICREGRCTPECAEDRDCLSGQRCNGGRCTAQCVDSRDCADDQVCRGGQCGPECLGLVDCAQGFVCEAGRCVQDLPPDNLYDGTFLISSTDPIQRCNDFIVTQFDSRLGTTAQNGQAFSLTFQGPLTVYNGQLNSTTFDVAWSGPQGFTHQLCGELTTSNRYVATFQSADFFSGTLTINQFYQLGECNCTIVYPITGARQ